MLNIPIVVAAYNRKIPLERLLLSLKKAVYSTHVKLIISVDGGDNTDEIVEIARGFEWPHGEKQIITSEKNMGLRNHILKCGRLAKEYDGIILFEDDLYVSPYFYNYVIKAQEVYCENSDITGVALYSHQYNETACLPFKPIEDGEDVFFMRVPCSWGQSWLSHQWEEFESWYKKNRHLDLMRDKDVPPDVRLWPNTSWKKYYYKYMIISNKYFVYPKISLSTNFSDPGVHHSGSNILQVPLLYTDKQYSFPSVKSSYAKYDAYCEIAFETLTHFRNELSGYVCEVDLYGMKNRDDIDAKYVITTQNLKKCDYSFSRKLKPHEMNVCDNIIGDSISLGLTENMKDYGPFLLYRSLINQDYVGTHGYFYSITKNHYKKNVPSRKVYLHQKIYWQVRGVLGRIKRFLIRFFSRQ